MTLKKLTYQARELARLQREAFERPAWWENWPSYKKADRLHVKIDYAEPLRLLARVGRAVALHHAAGGVAVLVNVGKAITLAQQARGPEGAVIRGALLEYE